MADSPRSRPAARRGTSTPTKIPTGPPLKKFLPYIIAGVAVLALVILMRTPRFAPYGAFGIGLVIMAALTYVAVSYRVSLAPDDRLRALLLPASLVAMTAAALPFGYTIFPPPPQGEARLTPNGTSTVTVREGASSLWLTIEGAFAPNATGIANYTVLVQRAGAQGPAERVDGTLRPVKGSVPSERRALTQLQGPGAYQIRLEYASDAIAPPMRVTLHAKPFSTVLLIALYAGLALLAVIIDVLLWRRGVEPSFAAALLLPLVAVVYFQRSPASNDLGSDLLAAGVVGALAGGLGGEALARLGRLVLGKGE